MSLRKITKITLEVYKDDKPVCATCLKMLKVGDYLDHFFPYYASGNVCKECLEKENRKLESLSNKIKDRLDKCK